MLVTGQNTSLTTQINSGFSRPPFNLIRQSLSVKRFARLNIYVLQTNQTAKTKNKEIYFSLLVNLIESSYPLNEVHFYYTWLQRYDFGCRFRNLSIIDLITWS